MIGSHNAEEQVLFWPEQMESCQTSEYCHKLAVAVATTLLTKLTDLKKSIHKYINNGILSYTNLKQNEKMHLQVREQKTSHQKETYYINW